MDRYNTMENGYCIIANLHGHNSDLLYNYAISLWMARFGQKV